MARLPQTAGVPPDGQMERCECSQEQHANPRPRTWCHQWSSQGAGSAQSAGDMLPGVCGSLPRSTRLCPVALPAMPLSQRTAAASQGNEQVLCRGPHCGFPQKQHHPSSSCLLLLEFCFSSQKLCRPTISWPLRCPSLVCAVEISHWLHLPTAKVNTRDSPKRLGLITNVLSRLCSDWVYHGLWPGSSWDGRMVLTPDRLVVRG